MPKASFWFTTINGHLWFFQLLRTKRNTFVHSNQSDFDVYSAQYHLRVNLFQECCYWMLSLFWQSICSALFMNRVNTVFVLYVHNRYIVCKNDPEGILIDLSSPKICFHWWNLSQSQWQIVMETCIQYLSAKNYILTLQVRWGDVGFKLRQRL